MATNISFGKYKSREFKSDTLLLLKPSFKGHVIFCNGYLSSPKKNPESFINVILDKVPDDISQSPYRGANMSEKSLTSCDDIMTNKELEKENRQGGGTFYSEINYDKTEHFRWIFSAKEQFEGYWEGYDNKSGKRYSQVFKEYFHASNNAHFVNGSHGLQSSGAHRVEHGIVQGYTWAKENWNIKNFDEVERLKEENPGILSYSPNYSPITIVGHSQGGAIAAGFSLGLLYYAFEMGWQQIPVNLLFLGTHQPQGLDGADYNIFTDYYKEDFISDWVLEFVAEIFTKEKLKQTQGIYEKMNELVGDNSWGGLINRAVQFTFPNDRALFVTRMGDIPHVKNACCETDALQIAGWYYSKDNPLTNFVRETDGYIFPKRLLNKAFNPDGSLKKDGLTYKEVVRKYWKLYNEYLRYRDEIKDNPKLKYTPSKLPIPEKSSFPSWFRNIIEKSIKDVEKEKENLYLKSELYRKRITALLAFTHVHEMELQAHFATVGLMFNEGTLSDWDKYQDQTIWDRVKETGKEIFYKVEYSKSNLTPVEKEKENLDYAEGKGKERLVSTAIANTDNIKKWINQAKEELGENRWYTDIADWWKGDKNYDGSGWGHGARTEIYEILGLDDKADNLIEAGILSMLQRGEIIIEDKSRLANQLTEDPAFKEYEKEVSVKIVNNIKLFNKNFNLIDKKNIQFGGKRAEGDMWKQFVMPLHPKYFDTWKVALNELTWLVRSVSIETVVKVKKDGSVIMYHSFEDTFDLRPSSQGERSIEYDVVSIITGFLYHDAAGGNDLMKIKANWSNSYSKEEVAWMALTDEERLQIEKEKAEQWKKRMKEAKEEWKSNPWYMGPIKN